MARKTRSPNYPALGLKDAVEGIKRVYDSEGNRRTIGEDLAEALGHKSLSGAARVKISALRKYGLLEPEGDGLKVSNDALSIINLPPEDPEHVEALHKASLRPVLFAELHETYGDTAPSDGVLRNFLLKKEFSPKAADEVIRLYRETMDLVAAPEEEYTAADEESGVERQEDELQRTEKKGGGSSDGAGTLAPEPFEKFLEVPVSKDSRARVSVDGPVTQEAIDKLIAHLQLGKDDLPSKAELERENAAAPAFSGDGESNNANGHAAE